MLVVEDLPRLDVADLKGAQDWLEIAAKGTAMVHLQDGDRIINCNLTLLQDKTPFGSRAWFACPACGARRKHLLVAEGKLACRACLGAYYRRHAWPDSTWRREVGRPVLRAWRRLKLAA